MADTVTVALTTNAVTVTETVNTVTVAPVANTVTVASVGAQGPKGDTGATGPEGPAGADGADGETYTLPVATDAVLGGVKVGTGLSITDGVLAVTSTAGNVIGYQGSDSTEYSYGDDAAFEVVKTFTFTPSDASFGCLWVTALLKNGASTAHIRYALDSTVFYTSTNIMSATYVAMPADTGLVALTAAEHTLTIEIQTAEEAKPTYVDEIKFAYIGVKTA